jgi:hypothetical protein
MHKSWENIRKSFGDDFRENAGERESPKRRKLGKATLEPPRELLGEGLVKGLVGTEGK